MPTIGGDKEISTLRWVPVPCCPPRPSRRTGKRRATQPSRVRSRTLRHSGAHDRGATATVLRSLQRIASATSTPADNGVEVLSVQRPAEIVNYRSMGGIPAILGAALAAGAVAALGLTLVASVRRRSRDLALLKTLGFTHRQLAGAVAWQSSVAVLIGTVLGVPLGIIVDGRYGASSPTRSMSSRPRLVPALTVALIALGALGTGQFVAARSGDDRRPHPDRRSC